MEVTLLLNSSPSPKPGVVAVSQNHKSSMSSSPQPVPSLLSAHHLSSKTLKTFFRKSLGDKRWHSECEVDVLYSSRSLDAPQDILGSVWHMWTLALLLQCREFVENEKSMTYINAVAQRAAAEHQECFELVNSNCKKGGSAIKQYVQCLISLTCVQTWDVALLKYSLWCFCANYNQMWCQEWTGLTFFLGKLPRLWGFFANVMRGRVLSLHNIH